MSEKLKVNITADEASKIIDWTKKTFVTVANIKNYPDKIPYSKFLTTKIQKDFKVKFNGDSGHYWGKKVSLYIKCPCGTKLQAEARGSIMKEGQPLEFEIYRPEVLAKDTCECCKFYFYYTFTNFYIVSF